MLTGTVATTVHGRYLYEDRGPARLLAGFHGYGEDAAAHFNALQSIPGIERWSVVAMQALHPFYTRSGNVVASWMTSLDRELAIADNLRYIKTVLHAIPVPTSLVFAGFSQGASMAARAAADNPCKGLLLLGGDTPPDVRHAGAKFPPVLLGRGTKDDWYSEEKFRGDLEFLQSVTRVETCVFDGGHEWADAYLQAAATFLDSIA